MRRRPPISGTSRWSERSSGSTGPRAAINHGLKALQISVSAWTAEALKQTMPASVFSRSTECHNQDKVSMGTIAARDALRVLELRLRASKLPLPAPLRDFLNALSEAIPLVVEDRALDKELHALIHGIRTGQWEVYGARVPNVPLGISVAATSKLRLAELAPASFLGFLYLDF